MDNVCSHLLRNWPIKLSPQFCFCFFLIRALTGRPSRVASSCVTSKLTNLCEYLNLAPSRLVIKCAIGELTTCLDVAAFIPRSIAHKPSTNALSSLVSSLFVSSNDCCSCFNSNQIIAMCIRA